MRSFGRIWNVPDARGIGFDESKEIAKRLISYYACAAYQEGGLGACDRLESMKMGPGFEVKSCRDAAARAAFVGFLASMTGRGDPGACPSFHRLAMHDSGIAEAVWCQATAAATAKGGLGSLCSESARLNPQIPGYLPECKKQFPVGPADCGDEKKCKERLTVYRAVSSGNYQLCPPDYRFSCELVAAKDSGCAKAADNLRSTYCALYENAAKRLHGQIGLTDEAVKELNEINRRIRKAGGKEEAEDSETPANER